MRHGIFSGDNSLDVTMRLTGGQIDVILKLQNEANISVHSQTHIAYVPSKLMLQAMQVA